MSLYFLIVRKYTLIISFSEEILMKGLGQRLFVDVHQNVLLNIVFTQDPFAGQVDCPKAVAPNEHFGFFVEFIKS